MATDSMLQNWRVELVTPFGLWHDPKNALYWQKLMLGSVWEPQCMHKSYLVGPASLLA